jgi:hypothetical protein
MWYAVMVWITNRIRLDWSWSNDGISRDTLSVVGRCRVDYKSCSLERRDTFSCPDETMMLLCVDTHIYFGGGLPER